MTGQIEQMKLMRLSILLFSLLFLIPCQAEDLPAIEMLDRAVSVREEDNSPEIPDVKWLEFPNTSLTDDGDGNASISFENALDSIYLRLDTTNDPLTAPLDILTTTTAQLSLTNAGPSGSNLTQTFNVTGAGSNSQIYFYRDSALKGSFQVTGEGEVKIFSQRNAAENATFIHAIPIQRNLGLGDDDWRTTITGEILLNTEGISSYTNCTVSASAATIDKTSIETGVAIGDVVRVYDSPADSTQEGLYRVTAVGTDQITVERNFSTNDTGVNLYIDKDAIGIMQTDGTNGNWIQSFSHQNKPLQIGGTAQVATGHSLTGEDVLLSDDLEVDGVTYLDDHLHLQDDKYLYFSTANDYSIRFNSAGHLDIDGADEIHITTASAFYLNDAELFVDNTKNLRFDSNSGYNKTFGWDETNSWLGLNTALSIDNTLKLKEQASANADTAAYGQIWVKTATPNELWFTDDAGTDVQLGVGTGDVTDVGDCTGGACFDGTSDGGTYLDFYDDGGAERLKWDATENDFAFADDVNIEDVHPHLRFTTASGDNWEFFSNANDRFELLNDTDKVSIFRVYSDNNIDFLRDVTVVEGKDLLVEDQAGINPSPHAEARLHVYGNTWLQGRSKIGGGGGFVAVDRIHVLTVAPENNTVPGLWISDRNGASTAELFRIGNSTDFSNKYLIDYDGSVTQAGDLAVNGDDITCDGNLTITPDGGDVIIGGALKGNMIVEEMFLEVMG